eukprot:1830482-Pleurochrysis_carterae.AAC.2
MSDDEAEDTSSAATEPTLDEHARMCDNSLRLVRCTQKQWAPPHEDSDAYRKERAVEYFNLADTVALDLLKLIPELAGWVPHVMTFIVPRQILTLGDPSRRSCDACESFGAACKHVIKKLTCQRHISATFTRGYIETAFKRACVYASLIHGAANAPYLQRNDASLMRTGRTAKGKLPHAGEAGSSADHRVPPPLPIAAAILASTVLSREAHMAIWASFSIRTIAQVEPKSVCLGYEDVARSGKIS